MQLRHLATSALRTLPAIAAPPLVVFFFPAIVLVARNLEYFPHRYRTGWPLYVAAGIALLAGSVLMLTTRWKVGRFMASVYMLSAPVWFTHNLLLKVRPSWVITALMAILWIVLAAVVAMRVAPATALRYLSVVGAALIVGSGVPALTAAQHASAEPGATAGFSGPAADADATNLPNIYHLIFDEYQTDIFEQLLDDGLRRELRGFAFFPDTTTPFGRTEMALASMFASEDYSYDVPPETQVARAFQHPEGTLQILGDLGYHRLGYLHRRHYIDAESVFDEYVLHDEIAEAGLVSGYVDLLVSLWVYAHAPGAISRGALPERHYEQLTAGAFLPDDAPPRSVISMRTLIRQEPSLPATGRYTVAHLILPHFPDVLDARCDYLPGETTDPLEQAGCANRLMREFLSRLRALGRLDNSIVIIQSDHGSWYKVVDGNPVDQRDEGLYSEHASYARARSLLLVHLPGVTTGSRELVVVPDRPTTLDDVMPTVFEHLGVDHEFSGNRWSLLAEPPPDRARYYHFYAKPRDGGGMVEGPLVRYRIEDSQAVRDGEILVPEP